MKYPPHLRQSEFPLNIEVARHTGRNWALLGGTALLTLNPYQNRILAPQAGRI